MTIMNCEIHITISTKDAEKATELARELHWKTSEIARDPLLGDETYFYLTTHAEDAEKAFHRLLRMVNILSEERIFVIREKIEVIIYDTKRKVPNEVKV